VQAGSIEPTQVFTTLIQVAARIDGYLAAV